MSKKLSDQYCESFCAILGICWLIYWLIIDIRSTKTVNVKQNITNVTDVLNFTTYE
jgi:hypothetical protein